MAENNTPAPSIQVNDILIVLFRHKWKIVFFTLLGIAAAAGVYRFKQPPFTSQAKLLIRYVTDSKGLELNQDSEIVRAVGAPGASVLNDEVEILLSQDALISTARRVGPSKILAAYGGGTNEIAAARLLSGSLQVDVGRNSGVISAKLSHKDPEIAQQALRYLVSEYLTRHQEIHQAAGTFDFLQAQTDQVRLSLKTIEDDLRREKNKVGVISLDSTKTELVRLLSSLRQQIKATETEIAESQARVAQFEKLLPAADTNSPAAPAVELSKYKSIAERLAGLKVRESEMLFQFPETSKAVQNVRTQIASTEKALQDLGIDPAAALAAVAATATRDGEKPFDLDSEKGSTVALQARLSTLKTQLEETMTEAQKIDAAENPILTLQRKKELAEDLYIYFSKNLERARIDRAVDTGALNNISVVQDPTAAIQDFKKLYKSMLMAMAGCFGAGFALAFALDFFIYQTFKRSKEVESTLRIPLLVSIPDFGRNGHSKLKRAKSSAVAAPGDSQLTNGEIAPWEDADPMLPYYEALRDRIVMSYAGDPHKPKIVGLTSCSRKSGVSRIATGLAASLSRDVERNVLLIGLERTKVTVSAFSKGRPDALDNGHANGHAIGHVNGNGSIANGSGHVNGDPGETRQVDQSSVEKNLYALATREHHTGGASIVQTFSDLMPKLKASDYDYIIFDLPPLTQTSGSLRLASQMERTVLILEAEETSKENAKRAKNLLVGSRANVSAVLNRTRTYGPKSLQTDL